jgi:hypothetical protein
VTEAKEAFDQFGKAVLIMSKQFQNLGRTFALAFTTSPKERRRLQRDWARMDRRPSLIHNGGKPT